MLLTAFVFFISLASAQTWVMDFNNCPSTISGTDCLVGGELVCGYDTGESPALQCSAPAEITVPAANLSTYSTNNHADNDGGYSINCEAYDAGDPYCDNAGAFWCERNETFHGSPAYRNTVCLGSDSGGDFGDTAIGICKTEGTDYWDCFGDNNCESTSTSDCDSSNNNHYTTATCNTGPEGGASGTCVCDTNYFACDSDIEDGDGCEHLAGSNCASSTGDKVDDQCFSASEANCTNYITGNSDCNDDDGDGNLITCNNQTDGDGCEITNGGSCGNSTGTYVSSQCVGAGGNCTASSDHRDCDDDDTDSNEDTCNGANGCEVDPGDSCTIGGLPGTVDDACPYNCAVDPVEYGWTGNETKWSGSETMLRFTQLGAGLIANLTGNGGAYWLLDKTGNTDQSGNITLGNIITFSLGETIDNLVDGIIKITGSLWVAGDVNADGTGNFSNITIRDNNLCNATGSCWTLQGLNESGGEADGQGLVDSSGDYIYDNGTMVFSNGTKLEEDFNTTYYADEDWINKNTTNAFVFNESKLATTYYNATQSQAVAGTVDGGTLEDTHHQDGSYDGITFNFSEASGSPGLDLRMNFTGIEDFNSGVMRYKTSSLAGDFPVIQLWNYGDSDWEDYPAVAESESFATITQPVFDSTEHISGGVVQMRLYKSSNGNTNNHYYVDWVAISKGYGTPAGEEVDPYWNADKDDYYNKSYVYNKTEIDSTLINNDSYLNNGTYNYNQTIPANTYTEEVNTSQSNWITNTFLSIANALTQYYNKTDIDNFGYQNETQVNASIISKVSQAFVVALGFATSTDIWAAISGNRTEIEAQITSVNTTVAGHTSTITNLTTGDCGGTDKMVGVYDNGTVKCATDQTGGGGGGNPFDQELNKTSNVTFDTVNITGETNHFDNVIIWFD